LNQFQKAKSQYYWPFSC